MLPHALTMYSMCVGVCVVHRPLWVTPAYHTPCVVVLAHRTQYICIWDVTPLRPDPDAPVYTPLCGCACLPCTVYVRYVGSTVPCGIPHSHTYLCGCAGTYRTHNVCYVVTRRALLGTTF